MTMTMEDTHALERLLEGDLTCQWQSDLDPSCSRPAEWSVSCPYCGWARLWCGHHLGSFDAQVAMLNALPPYGGEPVMVTCAATMGGCGTEMPAAVLIRRRI